MYRFLGLIVASALTTAAAAGCGDIHPPADTQPLAMEAQASGDAVLATLAPSSQELDRAMYDGAATYHRQLLAYFDGLIEAQYLTALQAAADAEAHAAWHREQDRIAESNRSRSSNESPNRSSGTRPAGSAGLAAIAECESGGDYNAENPTSSASGKYQVLSGTWNGYGGYARASDAPPEVQEAQAAQLYDGGRGSSHWAQCGG